MPVTLALTKVWADELQWRNTQGATSMPTINHLRLGLVIFAALASSSAATAQDRAASTELSPWRSTRTVSQAVPTITDSPVVPVSYSLSDRSADEAIEPGDVTSRPAHQELVYPSRVSHGPGFPRKPVHERPGDINRAACPPERYCEPDCERAGYPHEVAWWAKCSMNEHYTVGYVGGGSAWGFPHSRPRTAEEGTWGLDYSLLKRPKQVWMRWTCGRYQAGTGSYATDAEHKLLGSLFH